MFSFLLENFGINVVIIVIVIFTIFLLVTNLPKVMESITYFQSRKIKHIIEALESDYVNEHSKKILSENINRFYLARGLGINANSGKIQEIVRIYDFLKGDFDTIQIYRSIDKLPKGLYGFPIIKIKEVRKNIKRKQKINIFLMNLCLSVLSICFLLFIYSSGAAFYSNSFLTYEYFKHGAMYGISSVISLSFFIAFISIDSEYTIANRIVSHIINTSEES